MNPPSAIDPATTGNQASGDQTPDPATPATWSAALAALISSRIALMRLESQDAAGSLAKSAGRFAAAVACAFFTWALLVASGVSLLAEATGWPWNQIALGAAGLHLIAGIILARSAKSSTAPAFPVTRAEFQKDREWIENFQKNKKSNN